MVKKIKELFYWCAYLDFEHTCEKFKSYNDNYGHIEGDKCLAIVASAFAGYTREGMKAYRYGGEKFIVLLNDSLCDCVAEIADELRRAVEELAIPHMFSEVGKIVTVSVGAYAGIPGDGDKAMRFVDCADKAMYCSKQKGRNQMTIEMGEWGKNIVRCGD